MPRVTLLAFFFSGMTRTQDRMSGGRSWEKCRSDCDKEHSVPPSSKRSLTGRARRHLQNAEAQLQAAIRKCNRAEFSMTLSQIGNLRNHIEDDMLPRLAAQLDSLTKWVASVPRRNNGERSNVEAKIPSPNSDPPKKWVHCVRLEDALNGSREVSTSDSVEAPARTTGGVNSATNQPGPLKGAGPSRLSDNSVNESHVPESPMSTTSVVSSSAQSDTEESLKVEMNKLLEIQQNQKERMEKYMREERERWGEEPSERDI